MGRAPCCDKTKVKRGPWSLDEDFTLKNYIEKHGTGGNWIAFPKKAGLKRCGKSCRLRWLNYLRPNIRHGGFTEEEDNFIINLYHNIGSRWSVIASHLPGRTDNDIKNYWNTKLKKKLLTPSISSTTTINNMSANNHSSSGSYFTNINYSINSNFPFNTTLDSSILPYPNYSSMEVNSYVQDQVHQLLPMLTEVPGGGLARPFHGCVGVGHSQQLGLGETSQETLAPSFSMDNISSKVEGDAFLEESGSSDLFSYEFLSAFRFLEEMENTKTTELYYSSNSVTGHSISGPGGPNSLNLVTSSNVDILC